MCQAWNGGHASLHSTLKSAETGRVAEERFTQRNKGFGVAHWIRQTLRPCDVRRVASRRTVDAAPSSDVIVERR